MKILAHCGSRLSRARARLHGLWPSVSRTARCASVLVMSVTATSSPVAAHVAKHRAITPFPSMYADRGQFLDAIQKEKLARRPQAPLTGITVPHHLVAADLIARGFWAASSTKPANIILLSPDHFRKTRLAFATSRRPFKTVFGRLEPDSVAIDALLSHPDLFEDSGLFEREHGIGALLPFVAHFFPDARIIPIAISVDSSKADWDRAVIILQPLVGPRTLIVQSTDFSHYRPADVAQQRDQETLNVLSADRAKGIPNLLQSDHIDSKAAQYIQMRLQQLIGATGPIVVASRNSSQYSQIFANTTSYIVQLFGKDLSAADIPRYDDQQVVYFGGDVLLGRFLTPILANAAVRDDILQEIRKVTGDGPLIINLEGMVLDEEPDGLPTGQHIMISSLAAPLLKSMNVIGASVANNHSFDLGQVGLDKTTSFLAAHGIKAIRHGEIVDFGKFRLLALNFISKHQIVHFPSVEEGDLERVCHQRAQPPLLAFVHWGEQGTSAAGPRELAAARQLLDCGVGGIIGAHSHRAGLGVETDRGGAQQVTFSLGNLLFDQNGTVATGAILELRVFEQGTYATRVIPIPNLYDLGHDDLVARRCASRVGDGGPACPN